MALVLNQFQYIIEKLKPPVCAKCKKKVDRVIRRGLSPFEPVISFRLQCHGEEEILKIDYDMLKSYPRFPLDDIVAFRGNIRKILPESNINMPRPVARIISSNTTNVEVTRPFKAEIKKEEKKIRRRLNLDGIK